MHRFLSVLLFMVLSLIVAPASATPADDTQARNATLPDYATLHKQLAQADTPMLWLFVGDSITHGCLHTHGYRNFAEHWMEIVKWELKPAHGKRRSNDIVINAGVSGETATGFLSHAAWRLQQFRPHVVFINFGINDGTRHHELATFRRSLQTIVAMVRALGAIPVLQTPSLTLAGESYRPAYAQAIRELATEQQVLLVDHTATWETIAAAEAAPTGTTTPAALPAPRHLMNDNLHPNALGHRLMARTLARSLGITPPQSPTLNLPLHN